MTRSERFQGTLAALLAAGMAAACGGAEASSGADGNPTGIIAIYKLERVNSKAVPMGDGSHLFINGSLELHGDNTWCIELDWRGELGYSRVFGDRGTFSVSGKSVSFSSPSGEIPSFAGTVDGAGKVTVDYQFGNASDHFTFAQPADELTPRCAQ